MAPSVDTGLQTPHLGAQSGAELSKNVMNRENVQSLDIGHIEQNPSNPFSCENNPVRVRNPDRVEVYFCHAG